MTSPIERPPQQEIILDEVDEFFRRYVDCTDEQRHAMVLYAAATHVIRACVTFPRLLIASDEPESGKTLAMNVTGHLSSRTIDGSGSGYDLIAALAEAHGQPEKPVPTVLRDEASTVFGRDGSGGNRANPLGDVARMGYKKGATKGRSRGGVSERYSIFVPMIMTGLRTSVPKDIRTRCIVVTMEQGTPGRYRYFDARDAEPAAKQLGAALAARAMAHFKEVYEFRAARLGIQKLEGRRLEVWEPLFAIAIALGGQVWFNRCVSAFRALALAESDKPVLSPGMEILQLAAETAPTVNVAGFVPGQVLCDEISRTTENPRFAGKGAASIGQSLSNALPVDSVQLPLPSGIRARGYWLHDILSAWEAVRPVDPEEMEIPDEFDPFAIDDSVEDEEPPWEVEAPDTGDTGDTGKTAPPAQARTAGQVFPELSDIELYEVYGPQPQAPAAPASEPPAEPAGAPVGVVQAPPRVAVPPAGDEA
jgi:hypothetical protein